MDSLGLTKYETNREISCLDASLAETDIDLETESLKGIYNTTSGAHWLNNTGWLTHPNHCQWFGITCDDDDDHVIKIEVKGNNISGYFPINQLIDMKLLTTLDLANNKINGKFTADTSLFSLQELTYVDLSQNNLSGEVDALLAPALEYFNASHNNFSSLHTFKKFKRSQQTLRFCDVSYNAINQTASEIMKNAPGKLEQFILSNNLIHGSLPTLPTLEKLENIQTELQQAIWEYA